MQQQLQHNNFSNNTRNNNNNNGRTRSKTNKYCWTHGACAHTSTECKNKKTGHQDAATFENRMGDSTAFIDFNN